MKTKVTIHRNEAFFNMYRDYKIFVNDTLIGQISNHKTYEFEIEEESKLCIKIDWCSSNIINLQPQGNDIVISSQCTLNSWKMLAYPLYLTVLKDKYLLLEEVS